MKVDTAIEIATTPENIWEILTNVPSYSAWIPSLQAAEGEA